MLAILAGKTHYPMTWASALTKFIATILIAGMLNFVPTPSHATSTATEHTLIAAFLYNFLKFTEWPEGTVSTEIVLCTSKGGTFEELDAISGKVAQSKPVKIKRISPNEPSDDCQLLFLPREDGAERIRQWLALTRNKPILIVSNVNEFLDMGGMIGLMNDGRNLNFEVDLTRVRQANLKLSAQLLQIAREVRSR